MRRASKASSVAPCCIALWSGEQEFEAVHGRGDAGGVQCRGQEDRNSDEISIRRKRPPDRPLFLLASSLPAIRAAARMDSILPDDPVKQPAEILHGIKPALGGDAQPG